jgi:uncharacterized protein YbcI
MMKTQGQIEAEISEAIIKFEKEYMGRGPVETVTHLVDDMVLVRLRGVITRAEYHLATGSADGRGRDLIKQTRMELIEKARPLLEATIRSILGVPVKSLHTDISTQTGERVIIFTLEHRPENIGG